MEMPLPELLPLALSLVPSSCKSTPSSTNFHIFAFPPFFLCSWGIKYAFEIKTKPTLHVAVVTTVIVTFSSALAKIVVSLDNLPIAIYCVTVLAIIIWVT